MVIELGRNFLESISQGNEVDDVLVFVERSINLCEDTIVVSVQAFADVSIERDEVRSTKDKIDKFLLKIKT